MMSRRSLITGLCLLLLSACAVKNDTAMTDHDMHETEGDAAVLSLFDDTVEGSNKIAFTIFQADEDIFADYAISHEKYIHLIVVRDDLRHFTHLHPDMDDDGVWRAPFTAPAGGHYWLYADFVEENGAKHVIRFERDFPGKPGEEGIVPELTVREKTVDGFRVQLETAKDGEEEQFLYAVTDAAGKPAVLQPYLGALGHSVLINPAGGYVHAHADEKELRFMVPGPFQSPFYRIFTQFMAGGTVHTVSFDWEPTQ